MTPTIQTLPSKNLIGLHLNMSYAQNRTGELWRSFMPRRREIKNAISQDLFSMQVYAPSFNFQQLDPHAGFEKWAAVEVPDFSAVPDGMESFVLESGLYAVFHYKGPVSEGAKVFAYIFGTWLPASDYVLDQRPHFELLGEKYSNDSPESEEEIWIPIKTKDTL